MKTLTICILALSFYLTGLVTDVKSQSPDNKSKDFTPFATKQTRDWVGERFVFHPVEPSLRHYGYQLIYPRGQQIGKLSYEQYVGKTVKVTRVAESETGISGYYKIEMVVEETGEALGADAPGGMVHGLTFLPDIEGAKRLYVGKTLWRLAGSIHTFETENGKSGVVWISPFDPLIVSDVTVSTMDHGEFK